eukprot:SAG11_NODE_23389_length_389_cov_1.237931_2_plen_54_part_01
MMSSTQPCPWKVESYTTAVLLLGSLGPYRGTREKITAFPGVHRYGTPGTPLTYS